MYTAFFGLKENPFNLTPDHKYLYLSLFHKERHQKRAYFQFVHLGHRAA